MTDAEEREVLERIQRAVLFIGAVLLAVATFNFLWYVAHMFMLIFAGVLLAIFLNGIANFITRKTPIRYGWSLAIACFSFFLLLEGRLASCWRLLSRLS